MTMYTIIIYIYIYINIECKCFIYFQLPEMRMRIPLCKMFLVTVIPLQFPQTPLGFLISHCKSDCKISKNMFHHFYIFIYFRLWPVLFMGNGVMILYLQVTQHLRNPSPWSQTISYPPKKISQNKKHITDITPTKNKIHWQVLHVMLRMPWFSWFQKTLSWSLDPRYDFHLWTPATSGSVESKQVFFDVYVSRDAFCFFCLWKKMGDFGGASYKSVCCQYIV